MLIDRKTIDFSHQRNRPICKKLSKHKNVEEMRKNEGRRENDVSSFPTDDK